MQVVGVGRVRWEQMVCGEKVGGVTWQQASPAQDCYCRTGGTGASSQLLLGLGWGWKQLSRLPWGGGRWSRGGVSWETPCSCWP